MYDRFVLFDYSLIFNICWKLNLREKNNLDSLVKKLWEESPDLELNRYYMIISKNLENSSPPSIHVAPALVGKWPWHVGLFFLVTLPS
jgi:hypothetical protein